MTSHQSLSPLHKNVIDWCSRPIDGQDGLAPYRSKVAVHMSASPGGLRALPHPRTVLSGIGAIVLPDPAAVPKAHEAFTLQGGMANDKQQAAIETLGATLAKLHGMALTEPGTERQHDLSRIR